MADRENPTGYADEETVAQTERRLNENEMMVRALKVSLSKKLTRAAEAEEGDDDGIGSAEIGQMEKVMALEADIEADRTFLRLRAMTVAPRPNHDPEPVPPPKKKTRTRVRPKK